MNKTFEEWFEDEPMPETYKDMARVFYLLNRELSQLAWNHQQKKIDKLKEESLTNRRLLQAASDEALEFEKKLVAKDAEIDKLKKNQRHNCAGISGKQPINEACGGCDGCIEAQIHHCIDSLANENKAQAEFIKNVVLVVEFINETAPPMYKYNDVELRMVLKAREAMNSDWWKRATTNE